MRRSDQGPRGAVATAVSGVPPAGNGGAPRLLGRHAATSRNYVFSDNAGRSPIGYHPAQGGSKGKRAGRP
jgi:hypothetical protein